MRIFGLVKYYWYIYYMKKLEALRRIVKLLHPNLEIIVRHTKKNKVQLIVKNVWYTEFDEFHHYLYFKNGEKINTETFLENITNSYPYVTNSNTCWKYIQTNGKVYTYRK